MSCAERQYPRLDPADAVIGRYKQSTLCDSERVGVQGVAPTWLPGGASRISAVEELANVPSEPTRRLVLSERMMGRFLINGRTFDENRVDIRGRLGDVELWEIENRGRMDHPIHLHTYPFQIVSRNGVPERQRLEGHLERVSRRARATRRPAA